MNNTCPCGSPTVSADHCGSYRCDCYECRLCTRCIERSEAYAREHNDVGDVRIEYVAWPLGMLLLVAVATLAGP
jgi:hypothetical protein